MSVSNLIMDDSTVVSKNSEGQISLNKEDEISRVQCEIEGKPPIDLQSDNQDDGYSHGFKLVMITMALMVANFFFDELRQYCAGSVFCL